jgi:hypothetical protein
MKPKEKNKKYLDHLKLNQNQCTGFQDPTDDYLSAPLDLNDLLITHPASTYFFRLSEDKKHVKSQRLAVVDKSLTPSLGSNVIVEIDSELVLTKFTRSISQNITQIWGVVIAIITKFT